MNFITENYKDDIAQIEKYINNHAEWKSYSDDLEFNLKNKGVVYFIFVTECKTGITTLKYIGKSKGSLFKNRLKNHFHKKHEKTSSKILHIQKELKNNNLVKFGYITTEPESYRNLLEEELIKIFKGKLWNYTGDQHKKK